MSEETTGVEETPTGVEEGAADQEETQTDVADQEINEGVETGEEEGVTDQNALKGLRNTVVAERDKRQVAERENILLKQQLDYVKQLQSQVQEQPKDELDNLDDEDIWTGKDVKKYIEKVIGKLSTQVEIDSRTQRINRQVEQMQAQYPDYMDMIPVVTEVCNKIPGLEKDILESSNPALMGYAVAKLFKTNGKKEVNPAVKKQTDKIKQNQQRAKTLTDVPKGKDAVMDEVKKWASMSTEEFEKELARRKGHI